MRERLILLFVIFSIISAGTGFVHQASAQDVWDGTMDTDWYNEAENSFELTTAEELAGLASLVNNGNSFKNKTITLKNDLILNSIDNEEEWLKNPSGKQWTAIGTAQKPFKGIFIGEKHTISGLYIKTKKQYNGLFGAVENANIQDFGLTVFYIKADKYNGGIAGYSNESSFINVYNKGKIELDGGEYVGGFIGHTIDSDLENVSSHISIMSDGKIESVGGLIGNCEKTDIKNAYTIGKISATSILPCSDIGGLIGYHKDTDIDYVYTVCEISANANKTGGLIGYLKGNNNIQYCYYNTEKYTGERFGKNDGSGTYIVLGKTSSELRKSATFEHWDFTNVWKMAEDKNAGYPFFQMQEQNPPIVYPDIIHVKQYGNDTKDGSNWENAITLGKALEVLNSRPYNAKRLRINMAKGNYQTQSEAFMIKNNVLIYGGFNDSNNPTAKSTILYGSNSNRVLIIYNKDNLLNVTIEGLKIMEGTAHDEVADLTLNPGETTKYRGGGIFNANANTTLQQVVISNNIANNEITSQPSVGGGIYNYSGSITVDDCSIAGNISTQKDSEGKGGGIYLDNGTTDAIIKRSVISQNIATTGNGLGYGGGVYNAIPTEKSLTIKESTKISGNLAISSDANTSVGRGGGIYHYSGGLALQQNSCIENNIATKAKGAGHGGGMYINKGNTDITISDAFIKNNIAVNNANNESIALGGGIYNEQRNISIKNSEITQNTATVGKGNGSGGGIYHTSLFDPGNQKVIKIDNSILSENIAFNNTHFIPTESVIKGFGGGIYIGDGAVIINESKLEKNAAASANENATVGGNGGAIYNVASLLIIEASEILENTATNAQGFGYGGGISNVSDKKVQLFNTLIAKNTAGEQALGGGISNTVGKDVTLTNVTITANTAGKQGVSTRGSGPVGGGSGIYNYSQGHITIENTIVWRNKEEGDIVQYLNDGATHISRHSFISDLENESGQGDTTVLNGRNRVLGYAKFVDPENHNYRLKAASPLRNLAKKDYIDNNSGIWNEPGKDLDNKERVDHKLDLGAYESNPYNIRLTSSNKFGYYVPDSTEKYGIISPTEYEIDPNGSFEFAIQIDTNTIYTAVVKANGQEYQPDADGLYSLPNIIKDTDINVQLRVDKYAVILPAVQGVITDSVAGTYHKSPGERFIFSLKLEEGYNQSVPVVKANGTIVTPQNEKYEITVNSNINIAIEGVNLNEYTVKVPQVTGISTSPAAGDHMVLYDNAFDFTITKDKGYEAYNLLITADQNYPVETVDAAAGKYRINNVKHNIILSIALTEKPVHTITLNAIDEIETSPKVGQYAAEDGSSFKVTFSIPEKYKTEDIEVNLDGNFETFDHLVGHTYSFTIPSVKKNHTISIVKYKRYLIHLNKTEGVIFNPATGTHNVGKYDNFSFTISLGNDYDQSEFKVFANNSLISPLKIKDGAYTYNLSNIQQDYHITVEGVKRNDDTGIEDVNGKIKVYSNNKTLFIQATDASQLTIYTTNGLVHKQEDIPVGTTKMKLPAGMYIVKINEEIFKIII